MTAWNCKSSSQRDGREVIAKRTAPSRERAEQTREPMTRTGSEAGSDRANWQMAAKPIAINAECKSSGLA